MKSKTLTFCVDFFFSLDQLSTVLALPVTSDTGGITISALDNAQSSIAKFEELKQQLLLNDLTENEIQGVVHRRVDRIS